MGSSEGRQQNKDNVTSTDLAIRFASFLGDNAFEFYQQVVTYLGNVVGASTELVSGLQPAEQEAMVNKGDIHAVFTCGLPYVRKADQAPPLLFPLAAPVLRARRYQNRPIYFSDIIVRADSPYQAFEDLRGTIFACNEPHSFSGYILPCYHLLTRNETDGFFGQVIHSNAHAVSMDWVEAGQADASAIDSVVLEMEMAQRPRRTKAFRVIEHLGPAPMPPVVATVGLSDNLRKQFRQALLNLHTDAKGQTILKQGGVLRFAPISDRDYNPIRQIIRALQTAGIAELH